MAEIITDQIAQTFKNRIRLNGKPPETIEARIGYSGDGVDSKGRTSLTLLVRDPSIETDQEMAKNAILSAIRSIDPLKEYVKTETETNHMKRLAGELEWFRNQEALLNAKTTGVSVTHIRDNYSKWFEELISRGDWHVKHALNITKGDDGLITANIMVPDSTDPTEIVKNLEARKGEILTGLAERVAKYTPGADKNAIMAAVKNLNINITSQANENWKYVEIKIMSQERFHDMNQPGGVLPAKAATYAAQNPLMALQNGDDDKEPGKPQPHLQKALARAFLHSGKGHEDVFHLIAGKEDMAREVGKSLTKLKLQAAQHPGITDPKLAEKIDGFLADAVFKSPDKWGTPIEKRQDLPEAAIFTKWVGDPSKPYEPGLMQVDISIPEAKAKAVLEKISALKDVPVQDTNIQITPEILAAALQLVAARQQSLGNGVQVIDMADLLKGQNIPGVTASGTAMGNDNAGAAIVNVATPDAKAHVAASAVADHDSLAASGVGTVVTRTGEQLTGGAHIAASPEALAGSGAAVIQIPGVANDVALGGSVSATGKSPVAVSVTAAEGKDAAARAAVIDPKTGIPSITADVVHEGGEPHASVEIDKHKHKIHKGGRVETVQLGHKAQNPKGTDNKLAEALNRLQQQYAEGRGVGPAA